MNEWQIHSSDPDAGVMWIKVGFGIVSMFVELICLLSSELMVIDLSVASKIMGSDANFLAGTSTFVNFLMSGAESAIVLMLILCSNVLERLT